MRISNAFAALVSAVALAGCCHGPLVYVECMASSIHVDLTDDAGNTALADSVVYSIDGGPSQEAFCNGGDETTDAGCSSWWVDAFDEGTYTLEILQGDAVVATETLDVETPKKTPGECCSDVFLADLVVEVPTEST